MSRYPKLVTRPVRLDWARFYIRDGFTICKTGPTTAIPPYEFYNKINVPEAVSVLRKVIDQGQLWSTGREKTYEGEITDFIVEARDDLPQIAQNFSEPIRWRASARGNPAPIEVWNAYADDIISQPITAIVNSKQVTKPAMQIAEWNSTGSIIYADIVREYLWSLTRMATHFKIGWAIGIMQILILQVMGSVRGRISIDILDPSAGWGDRLCAALILGLNPTSVDPNTALLPAWEKIVGAVGGDANFLMIPFEDMAAESSHIVFTSPPYRPDDEKYTSESGQAHHSSNWNEWFRNFVTSAWRKVAPGGCLAMHISNTRFCPAYNLLLEFMGRRPDIIIGARGSVLWTVPVWRRNFVPRNSA